MCGLVGYSSKNPYNIDKLNYLLFHNSVERGRHSTGIYTPVQGVIKDALPAEEFLIKNPIKSSNLFIGHVRHATVGVKNKANAHPFEFSNLIGVHNGTLENHWVMLREKNISIADINVDSEALYKLLNTDSENENGKYDTLSKFDGPAALIFTDKRYPNRLYVYRNEDRPLHLGMIGKDMYLSSLPFMLKFIGCTDIKLFGTNYLYTIEYGKIIGKEYYPEYIKPKYNKHKSRYDIQENNTQIQHVNNSEFMNNLDKGCKINNVNLKGKWVRWMSDTMKNYGTTELFLTKDKWYYVTNYASDNTYDITIRDDTFKEITINKFLIDVSNINLDAWGVITENILYDDGSKIQFNEGDIVEIEESNIRIQGNKTVASVFHVKDNKQYHISTEFIRPATDEEAAKRAQELKDLIITPDNSIINQENNQNSQDIIRDITNDDIEEIITDDGESINKQEDKAIYGEELVPISVYEFALDIIDNGLDNLREVIQGIKGFHELDECFENLVEMVHDCYNVDNVSELLEEDNKEDSVLEKNKKLQNLEIK